MEIELNSSVPQAAIPRLTNQCSQILALFHSSPDGIVTNYEMNKVALKYSSRVSELRQAGHNIVCIGINRKTGVERYCINEVVT